MNVPLDSVAISQKISSRDYGSPASPGDYYGGYGGSSGYSPYPAYPAYGPSSSAGSGYSDPSYGGSPGGGVGPYGGSVATTFDVNKPPKKPTFPTYPSYYPPNTVVECQEHMMTSIIGDALQFGGIGKFGLIKSLVAAVTTSLLAKIPIILALKALIVKLVVIPIGFVVLAMPILVPIFLLFMPLWNRIKEVITGTSTTTPPPTVVFMMPQQPGANASSAGNTTGRANDNFHLQDVFVKLLQSDQCLEKLACQLGAADSTNVYRKPVSWLMEFLQTFKMVKSNYEVRNRLKRYRDAYILGSNAGKERYLQKTAANSTNSAPDAEDQICSNEIFPCDEPKFDFRQTRTKIKFS